ncbi:(2Fe-2S)-binding protein [Sphingomonas sp.]|jgi:bacterioferritin-associated ferredoxin|uniref:(2Fe-2S)-binding protein n=1 Tax=Sphingomonas sp. TaxID=28214 RepID=UPI002D808009|nr:(2Fe-2S)-binding protein [Sphingomonas sp.]HEU0044375.1 (2Fe-2S)-binding protein [Sphingomonas sp.]
MVVCICNAIRENQIRGVAQQCRTACQAYAALGCQAKCGQCSVVARAILDEERAAA